MGKETPCVIYKQTQAHETPKSFAFEIVSYDDTEGSAEITLKRPNDAPAFREIELVIAGRDFKKHIRVEAGTAPDAMRAIAADTIFCWCGHTVLLGGIGDMLPHVWAHAHSEVRRMKRTLGLGCSPAKGATCRGSHAYRRNGSGLVSVRPRMNEADPMCPCRKPWITFRPYTRL